MPMSVATSPPASPPAGNSDLNMTTEHRQIPILPECPRVHPIACEIRRSYPVGRQSFSRACQCEVLVLTITAGNPLPDNVQASLVTTLKSEGGNAWTKIPFVR